MTPDQIIDLLEKLAQKLTPAAEHVWELAVRQTVIDGVVSLIGGLVLVIATIVIMILAWTRYVKPEYEKEKARNAYEPGFVVFLFLLIGGFISFFTLSTGYSFLSTAINFIFNPEWQTLLKLAELIK